ncbi:MAG: type II secretion system protein [Candidatus Aminicenantes bacterium]|nr:MAG: type II secretion system protein [Candidatus Aminicenantes bacterium]
MAKLEKNQKGFTLIEMIVTFTILAILAAVAIPLAKTAIKREKEIELRRNLRTIREAIDAYKKLADENRIEFEDNTEGYPPDLETLVEGVEVSGGAQPGRELAGGSQRSSSRRDQADDTKIIKFLRRIPKDPMTNSYDWGLRSYQDDPDSQSWGGENVYDVYTKSLGIALDGTKYKEW